MELGMKQLQVLGRHALLFDDDATAAFINSAEALLPWNNLLIDRYDVRHLLQDPTPLLRRRRKPDLSSSSSSSPSELDIERYRDLPPEAEQPSPPETNKEPESTVGAYQAVAFSYGGSHVSCDPKNSVDGFQYSGFHPPFPVPESLLVNLPPTGKVHQIIARTAMFVSQNGGQSEIILRVKQGDNPTFGFLMPDHNLHAYFRFLVDHPELLIAEDRLKYPEEENRVSNGQNQSSVVAAGALSLLGSVYGSGEDEDVALQVVSDCGEMAFTHSADTVNETGPHGSEQTESSYRVAMEDPAAIKPLLTATNEDQPSSEKDSFGDMVATGSAFVKKIEADNIRCLSIPPKTALELDLEVPADGKRVGEDEKKEKFKMIIGGTKKDAQDPPVSMQLQCGTSGDAAPATVRLKNIKSSTVPKATLDDSRTIESTGLSTSGREFASSIGSPSFSYRTQRRSISKSTSNGVGGDLLSKGEAGRGTYVSLAKAMAKTAAIAAASEADSSEAGLTREQKQKAERLKRAKMFAAMIKSSGHHPSKPLPCVSAVQLPQSDSGLSNLLEGHGGGKATTCNNDLPATAPSNLSGPGFVDSLSREKEGSSLPLGADSSGKSDRSEKLQKKDLDDDYGERKRKKHGLISRRHEVDLEKDHRHPRKKHRTEDGQSKSYHSKSWHRHRHHSSSEDEHRHSSRHGSSRSRSDNHRRRSHSDRKLEIEDDKAIKDEVSSDSSIKLQAVEIPSSPVNTQPPSDVVDVPDDLRAKIRAMLLANM